MGQETFTETRTIAALATAAAPAGIGIIRVSGPRAGEVLSSHFVSKENPVEHRRSLILGSIINPHTNQRIDQGLAVYMPGPNSFTGEDVAEFQFHGGPLIARKILESLFASGVEAAEAGEFSKRAFINGKIDLLQAESIADVIAATSESALKTAQDHLEGKLSQYVDHIAEPLRDLLAQVEARLDFPEEDIEPSAYEQIDHELQSAAQQLKSLLDTYAYGQKVRDGYKVLLAGPPNAGKSSLLNKLLGRDRAIVTDISGTTRDLIEEECFIGPHRFVLCDSAGIRDSDDTVEKMGIELSLSKISWADLVIIVWDRTSDMSSIDSLLPFFKEQEVSLWGVLNKSDLKGDQAFPSDAPFEKTYSISAADGSGLPELQDALIETLEQSADSFAERSAVLTHARQQEGTKKAYGALIEATRLLQDRSPLELTSEEIRTALRALEEMVGKTYSDDILGRIFSEFCIGK